jgi:hypothetical protein
MADPTPAELRAELQQAVRDRGRLEREHANAAKPSEKANKHAELIRVQSRIDTLKAALR